MKVGWATSCGLQLPAVREAARDGGHGREAEALEEARDHAVAFSGDVVCPQVRTPRPRAAYRDAHGAILELPAEDATAHRRFRCRRIGLIASGPQDHHADESVVTEAVCQPELQRDVLRPGR